MKKNFTTLLFSLILISFNVAAQQGFTSLTPLFLEPTSATTGEKPQSKPWKHEGKWWAVFPNSGGTHLWRLDGTKWTHILRLSTRTTSKADCKVAGNTAHILLYQGASSQMASVEYVPSSGTYKLWSKRTSTVGLTLDKGVETATIDMDSRGRMWLASAGVSDINVRWSDEPYTNWSAPITIATGVQDDDICAVIAMPGKIGVLWSNQNTQRFGFKTHTDGDSPANWSGDEVPASQSAINISNGMADDHLNMAIAGDGTLYCAVKTEYDIKGYPKIALLVRRPTGKWDNLYSVDEMGTRPIVILNEAQNKIKVIYTAKDSGGNILYRESPTSSINFGSQLTLMSGTYNNATSSKDNYTSDVVVLASNSTYVAGVLAVDGAIPSPTAPASPLLASPANGSTGVSLPPTLSWSPSSGAETYQVQVSTSSAFSSLVFNQSNITSTSVSVAGLAHNTTYYWRANAQNAAGSSSWSSTWSFKTVEETTSPPASALVGHWKMDEGSGATLVDASGYGNNASTVKSPAWVNGVHGLALQLNGKDQYATVADHASLDITNALTLAVWLKPEIVGTQYVLRKGINNEVDGYELSLAAGGEAFFRINQATYSDTYRLNASIPYPADGKSWVHLAATFDGSTMKLYVNGVQNSSRLLSAPIKIAANDLPLGIGAQTDKSRRFTGAMDDARVYNRALSASEINALANNALTSSAETFASFVEINEELFVYPNPMVSIATLNFMLPETGDFIINLYDSKGTLVKELIRGSSTTETFQSIEIDGSELSNGLYFIRLQTIYGVKSIKMLRNR